MGQRCSKETGNVKGNGTDSKRPLALPECSASLDQLSRPPTPKRLLEQIEPTRAGTHRVIIRAPRKSVFSDRSSPI